MTLSPLRLLATRIVQLGFGRRSTGLCFDVCEVEEDCDEHQTDYCDFPT
jgi:hypothetical protein